MSFLSRFFKANPMPKTPIVSPDDSHLERRVKAAKWRNSRAVHHFVIAAEKQEQDANNARQMITDVLNRTDMLKAEPNANNSQEK